MWLQFVITPSKKQYHTHGTWFKHHDWVTESEIVMQHISAPYTKVTEQEHGGTLKEIRPPDWLKPALDGISKKTSKLGFDVGIRAAYVAKKTAYNINNRRNLRLMLRQYAAPYLNSFERYHGTGADLYPYSSGIISNKKVLLYKDRMLTEYRERSFFHPPMRHQLFSHLPWGISPFIFPNYLHPHISVLNTEELATIWHFPGQILKVPTFERIESKEASPPPNLPT